MTRYSNCINCGASYKVDHSKIEGYCDFCIEICKDDESSIVSCQLIRCNTVKKITVHTNPSKENTLDKVPEINKIKMN